MSKQEMIKHKAVTQIRREVEIHSRLEHPCVVRFLAYFQDEEFLYVVMEFADHGSLYDLYKLKSQKKNTFSR